MLVRDVDPPAGLLPVSKQLHWVFPPLYPFLLALNGWWMWFEIVSHLNDKIPSVLFPNVTLFQTQTLRKVLLPPARIGLLYEHKQAVRRIQPG